MEMEMEMEMGMEMGMAMGMGMEMEMDMERQINFIVPQIGRRKRRLVQNPELNPEGLQF